MAAIRTNDSYLQAQYQRLRPRIGHGRALGAVKHSIICACWHMLTTGELYRDLGGDYFRKRDPERQTRRLVAQLERLGTEPALKPYPSRLTTWRNPKRSRRPRREKQRRSRPRLFSTQMRTTTCVGPTVTDRSQEGENLAGDRDLGDAASATSAIRSNIARNGPLPVGIFSAVRRRPARCGGALVEM